jgi:hypothetical protein
MRPPIADGIQPVDAVVRTRDEEPRARAAARDLGEAAKRLLTAFSV